MNEQVLVFPKKLIDGKGIQGYVLVNNENEQFFEDLLHSDQLSYMDRKEAETNYDYLQLIPYNVLINTNGEIFCYQRTKKGGDKRLHGEWSLGIGGHLNKEDGDVPGRDSFDVGLLRELKEEVGLGGTYAGETKGFIYSENTDVSKVHLGVVSFIYLQPDTKLEMNDPSLSNGMFETIKSIKSCKEKFEDWSKLIIELLV